MQTCTGPIMYDTQRRGGGRGKIEGRGRGNRSKKASFLYMKGKGKEEGKMQETDVNRNEEKILFVF